MNDDVKKEEMQALEDELIARIKRGDPIHEIRGWFLDEMTKPRNEALGFFDLTPFVQAFMNQLNHAFQAWQREQEDRARNGPLN
jgi:hypothetical protein